MPQILGCLAYRECYSEGEGDQKEVREHQLKREIVKVRRENHAVQGPSSSADEFHPHEVQGCNPEQG